MSSSVDIAAENTSSHVSSMDDKESSNVSSSVDNAAENTSSHVSPMDDKDSSNVSSSVDNFAENTSSHVSHMNYKELLECIELNVHMKHNELEIRSKTQDELKTQSFPYSEGVSDKKKHTDQKHYTVEKKKEDEHVCNTQLATQTDENVNKTSSSILDEQGNQGHLQNTESDEGSHEELEITVLDSEDEEIQLLVDQRDVDYSFLASLCDGYVFHGYESVGIVAN